MNFDNPPRWARTWCYYFLVGAVLAGLTSILTLGLLVTSYSEIAKSSGGALKVGAYSLVLVIQAVNAMVLFWMCRSSLPK